MNKMASIFLGTTKKLEQKAPFQTTDRVSDERGFLAWWYRLAAPPALLLHASFAQREAVRRGRLASTIILILIVALIPTIPIAVIGTNGANHVLLPALLVVLVLVSTALLFNRRGWVKTAGAIVVFSVNIGFFLGLLNAPGGLGVYNLPVLDLLVIPELLAVSLLPEVSVFPVTLLNSLFVCFAITIQPHAADLKALIAHVGYYGLITRSVLLLLTVAVVTYLWVRNATQAIARADQAEELDISVQQQKVFLEEVNRLYQEHALAAITDVITGLPNHRAVMSKFDDMLTQCQRMQRSCAVLFIDLDHFKRINDTWGHRAGDMILHEVAQRLHATLRENDFVGRYGGEEFAILLNDTGVDEASQIAERLRVAVNAEPCPWQAEDEQKPILIPVTTSIGVAVYQLHGILREQLISNADSAMYRAKRAGRNRVCIADVGMDPIQEPAAASLACHTPEEEVVQALTAAAHARDCGTSAHAYRMVQLAEATAHALGRSEEEIHLIRLAALLHDIGKIGIPDAILHKPGPLTSDEWIVMRSHPEVGRMILEQTGGNLRVLSNIVVAHHERWDGHGYPKGLVGESIPLGARILSVVDSYDAMTSRRTYRELLSHNDAKAELQRCAGSQFDSQVVEAFLSVLESQEKLKLVEAVI